MCTNIILFKDFKMKSTYSNVIFIDLKEHSITANADQMGFKLSQTYVVRFSDHLGVTSKLSKTKHITLVLYGGDGSPVLVARVSVRKVKNF